MNLDNFFRGLLAALRLEGKDFIETRDDLHHEQFRRVADALRESGAEHPNVPATFIPSPFTGRYRELDDALLRLQHGLLGAQNPFYPGVNLSISTDRANRILDTYSESDRCLFSQLARIYLGKDSERPTEVVK